MLHYLKDSAITGALVLTTAFIVTGCGGGHEVVRPTVSVSIGQQLIDLKKARDTGAITASDYERNKKQLINSVE